MSSQNAPTSSTSAAVPATTPAVNDSAKPAVNRGSDWRVIRSLVPYLWDFRWRVGLAIVFLVTAKLANIGVPLILKEIIDSLDK